MLYEKLKRKKNNKKKKKKKGKREREREVDKEKMHPPVVGRVQLIANSGANVAVIFASLVNNLPLIQSSNSFANRFIALITTEQVVQV